MELWNADVLVSVSSLASSSKDSAIALSRSFPSCLNVVLPSQSARSLRFSCRRRCIIAACVFPLPSAGELFQCSNCRRHGISSSTLRSFRLFRYLYNSDRYLIYFFNHMRFSRNTSCGCLKNSQKFSEIKKLIGRKKESANQPRPSSLASRKSCSEARRSNADIRMDPIEPRDTPIRSDSRQSYRRLS